MIRVTMRIGPINTGPLFAPGGSVNSWSHWIARDVRGEARNLAPQPGAGRSMARSPHTWTTGNLVASIYSGVSFRPRRNIVEVGARAPYAVYVHEGTANNGAGYIYSNSGRPMPIKRAGFVLGYADQVRGQKANPFLVDGYNTVARVHPALPHMI